MVRLSVLDQSPISEGSSAKEALSYTVKLAQLADELGFTRFWVSEHHDSPTLAGSSPEVLISHLASVTKRIRIGSGGVMLPHYSSYKVAENFNVLATLFPGRIDVGVGRAPGGMPRATYALNNGEYRDVDRFPEQLDELAHYLNDTLPEDHPYYGLQATPVPEEAPPIWMLGSSPNSAQLAGEKGLPYMFAHFINNEAGLLASKVYQKAFQPSPYQREAEQGVAVFFACAETDEEADEIASSLDLASLWLGQGIRSDGTPSPETVKRQTFTAYDLKAIESLRERMVVGSPKRAKEQIEAIAEQYGAEEVMLVMIAYDYEKKLKAYELIAREMLHQ